MEIATFFGVRRLNTALQKRASRPLGSKDLLKRGLATTLLQSIFQGNDVPAQTRLPWSRWACSMERDSLPLVVFHPEIAEEHSQQGHSSSAPDIQASPSPLAEAGKLVTLRPQQPRHYVDCSVYTPIVVRSCESRL